MRRLIVISGLILTTASCISRHTQPETPNHPPPVKATAPSAPSPAALGTEEKPKAALEAPTPLPSALVNPVPTEVTDTPLEADVKAASSPVDARKSLLWLKHGNERFVTSHLRKDGQSHADVVRLSANQAPHAIVLSCSDSRVPPELVFDQKLGEIFVVRTAGESIDANVVASIEYAVKNLGPHLLLVMGHSSCGAIKAALETPVGTDTGSPALNFMLHDLQPRLASNRDQAPSADLAREAWDNAVGVASDLQKDSAIIRNAVKSGALTVQPALYHMDSGKVTFE